MENTRIRKLLRSEYPQLCKDAILIESPFAETTRDGRGLREVALGLTTTRLIVATDVFTGEPNFRCPPGVDPSIETLQLVSITPLDYLTINVFRKKRRKTLKTRWSLPFERILARINRRIWVDLSMRGEKENVVDSTIVPWRLCRNQYYCWFSQVYWVRRIRHSIVDSASRYR